MPVPQTRDVIVIGGPNGAGKTTWAYRRLPQTLEIREFVNADEIARGISPLDPEASALAAGRLMIQRLNELHHCRRELRVRDDLFRAWARSPAGKMSCSRLPDHVDISCGCHRPISRLPEWRGASAGEDIASPTTWLSEDTRSGLRNMRHIYLPLADEAYIHDNSDESGVLIAERRRRRPLIIHDRDRWKQIEDATR